MIEKLISTVSRLLNYLPQFTRVLGASALVSIGILLVLGLGVTPPDQVQGDLMRLIYVHPALAMTMYLAFGVTAVASALYLFPKTRHKYWDLLAGSAAEVGLIFCGLALVTGSVWGRPTWGVWWTWDARLTTTALLFTLFIGYIALRRMPGSADSRAKQCAVAALIAVADIPIVHFSVEWWRTLHQGATLSPVDMAIEGSQLMTMLFSFIVFSLIFAWLLIHRFAAECSLSERQDEVLNIALEERRNEAKVSKSSTINKEVGVN